MKKVQVSINPTEIKNVVYNNDTDLAVSQIKEAGREIFSSG